MRSVTELLNLLQVYTKFQSKEIEIEIHSQYNRNPDKLINVLLKLMEIYKNKHPFDFFQGNDVFNEHVGFLFLPLIQQYCTNQDDKKLYLITVFASCVFMVQLPAFIDGPSFPDEIDIFNEKYNNIINNLENSKHFELLIEIIKLSNFNKNIVFNNIYKHVVAILTKLFQFKKGVIDYLYQNCGQNYLINMNNDIIKSSAYTCYIYTILTKIIAKLEIVHIMHKVTKENTHNFWELLSNLNNFIVDNDQEFLKRNKMVQSFIQQINDNIQQIL